MVVLLTLCFYLTQLAGAKESISTWLESATSDGSFISSALSFEVGKAIETEEENQDLEEAPSVYPEYDSDTSASPLPDLEEYFSKFEAEEEYDFEDLNDEEDAEPEIVETTIQGGLTITNDTSYDIDIATLMAEQLNISLPSEGPQILIIHTHSSEAYTPDMANMYIPTDVYRTEDDSFNVIRVGDELTEALEEYGLSVIHDRGIYDYPSYTGSYNRSAAAVESYLAQYPDIAVVLDIHRDAIGDGDVVYKTKAEVEDVCLSQVMLLVGTGENGLYHPSWEENLKLALKLQSAVIDDYPTLARPVALKQERYNQHLTTGSLILEVGSSGNTLEEALGAIRLFAKSAAPVFQELVADG